MKFEKHAVLAGHSGSVYTLLPFGNTGLYSGGGDRLVAQWDLNHPEEGMMLAKTNDIIYSLLQIPDGPLLVGQAAGGIHVIDTVARKEERLLQYHRAGIFNMMHLPVSNTILTLSGDGELGVLNDQDLSLKKIYTLGGGKLRAISIQPEKGLLAIGSGDGRVRIFSLTGMEELVAWQAHAEQFSVNAVCISPDGNWLLTGSRDAHLKVYDINNGFTLVKDIPAHNYAIYAIEYCPDGSCFATASRDKTIKIWDPHSLEVLQRIDKEREGGHVNSVNKLVWHPYSSQLISASDDRSVLVWNRVD
jgi:WD40 repeat protein